MFSIPETAVPLDLATITLRILRPTTLLPQTWDTATSLRITLSLLVDGVEHRVVGQATGGIRVSRQGIEAPAYVLMWTPTWGFFGARVGLPKRLGETRAATYTARLLIEHLAGTPIDTVILVEFTTSQAPPVMFSSSVAFDAATAVSEGLGDGVVSLTHTASGADRAAFAGVASGDDHKLTTSVTYGGTTMTEMWDVAATDPKPGSSGHYLIAPPTTAATVTATMAGSVEELGLGVISMTGVHQTTPVGTSAMANATNSTPTVTVADVGTDDLVVDNMMTDDGGVITVGANQTQRWQTNGIAGDWTHAGSTQIGSLGGVMSWTHSGSFPWRIGAVAFKPVAAGGQNKMRWGIGMGVGGPSGTNLRAGMIG